MKKLSILLLAVTFGFTAQINAQTADEVLDTYFENTGGLDNWKKMEGIKISAKVNQQGMEIPVTIYNLKDGRQASVISFQGKEIKQNVFDGETTWSHNFMTQKAEKSDAEANENMKLDANDFPDPFIDYKDKGYTVENLGKEDFNGTEVFKIKLVKEPVTVDGNKEDNVSFYFFDTENFVPIAMQTEIKSGPAKGSMSEVTFSDYQEVEGVYMPFALTQGMKGQPGVAITVESIEFNPVVEDTMFTYPMDDAEKGKE